MEVSEIQKEFYEVVDREDFWGVGRGADNEEDFWQDLRELMLKLKQENPDIVFEALIGIFLNKSRPGSIYRDQYAAGGLLWKLKPKHSGNLRENIIRSFENWDISIETLPWYFAEVAGKERVCDELEKIITKSSIENHVIRADGFLYWLKGDLEYNRRRLNKYWDATLRG
ncbi:MAG: hypothetical protein JSW63_04275 [Ignavibacterium sp.]|nr:MAG: hypothetical protein JSW63_04275 [Ignavibacterium sp.]